MPKAQSDTRISLRTDPKLKDLIERAALTSGLTVTDYALSVLVNHAKQVLDENCVRILSSRDTEAFLTLLDKKSEPNATLKRAAKRYRERAKRSRMDD
jgi:uncharacterized protein (DUF1778 family)